MHKIKVSLESDCAQQAECYPTTATKKVREAWIQKHDLFMDSNERVFALVQTDYRVFFMDAVTGSLYDFGQCLSSSQLKIKDLKRSKAAVTKLLNTTTLES